MEIQKWGYERRIDPADWVCGHCGARLDNEGVTTGPNTYAHPECDPLTQMLHREFSKLAEHYLG